MTVIIKSLLVFLFHFLACNDAVMLEEDRIDEYNKRGYTWPPKYIPETEGWKRLMERRFEQVSHVKDGGNRWDGWVESVTAAYTTQNFTQDGWGLTRPSEELVQTLRQAVQDGLPNAGTEGDIDVIVGPKNPLFIRRTDLTRRVLHELKPLFEAWSGVKLVPANAYGFRLYQNESALLMHIDKTTTHVISGILHIDSSDDAEPWPIVIEDLQGNTIEAVLTPGDLLFYESAKCFHGRPKSFNGSWYTSVFIHYYPEGWNEKDHDIEGHYGVPPHWRDVSQEETEYPPLEIIGTSMWEPSCADNWCALAEAVKYTGPAEEDFVLSTSGRYQLYDEEKAEL